MTSFPLAARAMAANNARYAAELKYKSIIESLKEENRLLLLKIESLEKNLNTAS